MSIDLDRVRAGLGPRHHRVLVAATRGGEAAGRAFGVPETADAEIGSVSKGLTGLLFRQMVGAGDVAPDATLGELLGRPEASYAPLTLEAVAQHRSGLPRLQPDGGARSQVARTWALWRRGENPYGDTIDELLAMAADAPIGKPRFAYSNLGFELLGAALSRAARVPYAALLRERVLEPLGMDGAYAPSRPSELRADAVAGLSRRGRPQEAWVGEALGPAGGVRCTAADLAALLTGLVSGTAPGIDALEATSPAQGASRIGAAWMTTTHGDREVVWHNGRTGGFGSW
ncbi:serine hydrolase, partial [uncultured Demequina sp.]|uniref:serine hydrolase domain-containing protein n=1 Tax=uncultured Demequina sp. TaxID=693499 RepID=UPI0025D0DD74